jgi:hypothetical protein
MCKLTLLTSLRCLSISGNLSIEHRHLRFWSVGWWQLPSRLTSLGLTGFDLSEPHTGDGEDDAARCAWKMDNGQGPYMSLIACMAHLSNRPVDCLFIAHAAIPFPTSAACVRTLAT